LKHSRERTKVAKGESKRCSREGCDLSRDDRHHPTTLLCSFGCQRVVVLVDITGYLLVGSVARKGIFDTRT
jgi:hypothetical protein